MAQITFDAAELAGRFAEAVTLAERGDEVLVTSPGHRSMRLLPCPHLPSTTSQVLGLHPSSTEMALDPGGVVPHRSNPQEHGQLPEPAVVPDDVNQLASKYGVRYPWAKWFKLKEFTLIHGRDFFIEPHGMRGMVYNRAGDKGLKVRVEMAGGTIKVVVGES